MFKHNLHITVHAKDQKTLDAVFANISNNNGVFSGQGSFSNGSTWECKVASALEKVNTTEAEAIKILDRVLVGHAMSTVDWEAMKDASQLVKEYKEKHE